MNAMRLRSNRGPGFFERYFSTVDALVHRCPVCRVAHRVSAVRAQFAYGYQLTCSPDCEAERRRKSRAAYRRSLSLVRSDPTIHFPAVDDSQPAGETSLQLESMTCQSAPSGKLLETGDHQRNRPLIPEHRKAGASVGQLRPVARMGEHKAVISAIVESTDVLKVRRAIFQAGGESVGVLKCAPVPRSSKVRIFIGMKADALDSLMSAIMRSVAACEFGRVIRM